MKKVLLLLVALCLLFSGAAFAMESDQPAYVPGELLVKFKSNAVFDSKSYASGEFGASTIKSFDFIGVLHVKLPAGQTVEQALERYKNDPNVEYAEPNYYRYTRLTPNDTRWNEMWAHENTGQAVNGTSGTADADMDTTAAWDVETGTSNSILVAVIDTGVDYRHPDLAANIWNNTAETPNNGIDDDGNGYVDDWYGWDFVDNDKDPMDSDQHGTHVSGTIAAVGDNNLGVTGVSWSAKIMCLRALNGLGVGTSANTVSAIEYANANGARVINMSLGSSSFTQSEKDAIDASSAVVVCAAGNSANDNDSTPEYPASYDSKNIVSVAATDQNDGLAWFSNYGLTTVDVGAPGTNIASTIPDRQVLNTQNFDGVVAPALPGNWSKGGTNSTWATDATINRSAPNSLAESPGGNYQNNTDSWAKYGPLNLTGESGAKLDFYVKGASELGTDGFYIETSPDGTNWTIQLLYNDQLGYTHSFTGSLPSWTNFQADIGAYDGNASFYYRFRFISDASNVEAGWNFDDISVTTSNNAHDANDYDYLQGTSMATPQVAGLAALLLAKNPGLTNLQVKAAIEKHVDAVSALNGKTVTGGRVNANSTLTMPTASAGGNQTVTAGSTATLTGSNSSHPTPTTSIAGYLWEQTGGTSVSLSSNSVANPTFEAPTVKSSGDKQYDTDNLTFRLTVTYSDNSTATDTTTVTVTGMSSGSGGTGTDVSGGCFIQSLMTH